VAIPWIIKEPSIIGEKRVNDVMCYVLHCVRKEHPIVKFKGKVDPMYNFAPRINDRGVLIRGYYVGYYWNGEESLDEIPKRFDGKFTLKGRKPIPKVISTLKIMISINAYFCVNLFTKLTLIMTLKTNL
jgi:hypothetical protein